MLGYFILFGIALLIASPMIVLIWQNERLINQCEKEQENIDELLRTLKEQIKELK